MSSFYTTSTPFGPILTGIFPLDSLPPAVAESLLANSVPLSSAFTPAPPPPHSSPPPSAPRDSTGNNTPPHPPSTPSTAQMPPKKNGKASPKKPKQPVDDDCDDMPPLESMPPKPASTKAALPPKPTPSKPAPPAAIDDSDDDMPPLTDSTAPAPPKKDVPVRAVSWAKGTLPSRLFAFDKLEKSGGGGVEGAYELLGWRKDSTDGEVIRKAEEIMATERSAANSNKSTSPRLAALLLILCSRAPPIASFSTSTSTAASIARLLRLLYLSEAQLHLSALHLPLPPDAVVPSDVDLRTDASAVDHLTAERTAHETTRSKLRAAQLAAEQATSGATAARSRAERVEAEAKSLRGEVSALRGERDELRAQAREGWEAKRRCEDEVGEARAEGRRWRREAEDAKDEADRLRRSGSRTSSVPTLSTSSIPSSVSSDKKDFVIARLSKQVQQLNQQLKDKNEEIVKLMCDMSEMSSRL
ncbi:hypothetical protein JCM10207_004500 [Rhodosporidiobolus poonsookiae]